MSDPTTRSTRPGEPMALDEAIDTLTLLIAHHGGGAESRALSVVLRAARAGRPELHHAGWAAHHVLALVVAADPTFRVTADVYDAMFELLQSVARALTVGRAR
jgi:hypothetical protein